MTTKDEKMWYSIKEAAVFLKIDENRLLRKIIGLNIETTPLPGEKGVFLAQRDVLELERMMRGIHS